MVDEECVTTVKSRVGLASIGLDLMVRDGRLLTISKEIVSGNGNGWLIASFMHVLQL